jgi:L-ascorbate metabolism protein UlaG (beta-lactamase superfamily)
MADVGEPRSIAWIGHSTVLVETDGVRILTDPLLRSRVGHLRRVGEAPGRIEGEVDAVLVSHVHHDHLDLPSLERVRWRRLVVPRGAGLLLEKRGFENVVELGAGEELSVGALTVAATQAQHVARRFPSPRVTPSLGYLLRGSTRLYFAGDTDIFDGMRDLAPGLDVALLPIDGWGPRLGPGHLDSERAAEALRLLRPRVAVPIHWGTYKRLGLSRDPAALRRGAERFERLARQIAPDVEVRVLAPGERLDLTPLAATPVGTAGR